MPASAGRGRPRSPPSGGAGWGRGAWVGATSGTYDRPANEGRIVEFRGMTARDQGASGATATRQRHRWRDVPTRAVARGPGPGPSPPGRDNYSIATKRSKSMVKKMSKLDRRL